MGQALSSMKAIFGGNPTEGEREVLRGLQAGASLSPDSRKRILDKGIALAEKKMKFYTDRADELRGGSFYKPKDGQSPYRNIPRTSAGEQGDRTSVDYSTMSDADIKKKLGIGP
jgi:hypothetical protein